MTTLPDPNSMSPTERRKEIARLAAEIEQDRYRLELKRLRLKALAEYSNGAVCHGREDMREVYRRRKAPGPPPIVAGLWGKPRKRPGCRCWPGYGFEVLNKVRRTR